MNCQSDEAENADAEIGFDEIFALHHRLVFKVAYGVVRDAALSEDVTQEVFLKLYRHIEDSRIAPQGEHLRAWLLRVCLNVARNTIRGNTRAWARETKYVDVSDDKTPQTPADDYERRVEIEAAQRTLDKLKEPTRSCLLLQQQGLAYREIAEVLSLNEKSVGSFIARGRREFVRLYGKIGGR